LSNGGSMRQKQPPAKVAVARALAGAALVSAEPAAPINNPATMTSAARVRILFISFSPSLDPSSASYVPVQADGFAGFRLDTSGERYLSPGSSRQGKNTLVLQKLSFKRRPIPKREEAMSGSKKVWNVSLTLLVVLSLRLTAQPAADLDVRKVISLSSRVIDTSRPEPAIPKALRVRPEDAVEDEIVLVKFPAPVTAGQMQALNAASLRIYAYLPFYAYLVKMPAGGPSKSSLAATGASWSGPYHPAYKISPAIGRVEAAEAKGDAGYRPVLLQIYPDADLGEVMQKLRDLGVKGIVGARSSSFFSRVRLLLSPS